MSPTIRYRSRDEDMMIGIGEFISEVGVLDEVYAHMAEELPNECVGLIWGDGYITPLINQARSPERFTVSIAQMSEALTSRTGMILCIYHSHPGGTTGLSVDDQKSIREEWSNGYFIPWLVVTMNTAMLWYVDKQGKEILSHRVEPTRNGLVHA